MTLREYPKVWNTFKRITEDGKTLEFVIEDTPEALWSSAVEFMLGNYIREDVWWTTAGPACPPLQTTALRFCLSGNTLRCGVTSQFPMWIVLLTRLIVQNVLQRTAEDPQAIEEYRVLLTSIVQQKMSLACYLVEGDGTGRTLVGVNMCMPQEKGRFVEHNPPTTKAGLLSLCMFSEAMKVTAIYDKYDVSKYLMGAGLSVSPEYRGHGLAAELLKCRMLLAKEEDFTVTGGIFTSAPAQRSAEKAGMECVYSVPYKQFGEQCKIDFDTTTQDLKIFAVKIQ